MKRILTSVFIVCIMLGTMYGQRVTNFSLNVQQQLPVMDFAGFSLGDDMQNAPLVFTFIIGTERPEDMVRMKGMLYWQDVNSSSEAMLIDFTTEPFRGGAYSNIDLGTPKIRIPKNLRNTNETAIKDNLKKGKPVGKYRLVLTLLDPRPFNNEILRLPNGQEAIQEKTMEFLNPTQTITLTLPQQGMMCDPGNVIASWSAVQRADYYLVRAAVRQSPNQSLEDALSRNTPLINNKAVNTTSVNLRELLEREWSGGQEIALQITAVFRGLGDDTRLFTTPVSFFLQPVNNATVNVTLNSISTVLGPYASRINPEFLNRFMGGQITINGFQAGDGTTLTQAEVTALLAKLQANPNLIISLTFNPR